jgi:hypothetical protein
VPPRAVAVSFIILFEPTAHDSGQAISCSAGNLLSRQAHWEVRSAFVLWDTSQRPAAVRLPGLAPFAALARACATRCPGGRLAARRSPGPAPPGRASTTGSRTHPRVPLCARRRALCARSPRDGRRHDAALAAGHDVPHRVRGAVARGAGDHMQDGRGAPQGGAGGAGGARRRGRAARRRRGGGGPRDLPRVDGQGGRELGHGQHARGSQLSAGGLSSPETVCACSHASARARTHTLIHTTTHTRNTHARTHTHTHTYTHAARTHTHLHAQTRVPPGPHRDLHLSGPKGPLPDVRAGAEGARRQVSAAARAQGPHGGPPRDAPAAHGRSVLGRGVGGLRPGAGGAWQTQRAGA